LARLHIPHIFTFCLSSD